MSSKFSLPEKQVFVDPSYPVFDHDGLFDMSNSHLNRDDQLRPFDRLRRQLGERNVSIHTADYFLSSPDFFGNQFDYYSLGCLDSFERLSLDQRVHLAAFVIMEPPVVLPDLYEALPKISTFFDRIYLPNTTGDGYSLEGVSTNKMERLYWPIPYDHVLEPHWSNSERMKRVVVINGNHKPAARTKEQYSLRIEAMDALAKVGVVDLYGYGWNKWWTRRSMWAPYWNNIRSILSIYKGSCESKFDILRNYQFCLCFENMEMDGYITEKIFDCLYAGVVPLYMGAPNILEYLPAEAFVDCRKYASWMEMWDDVSSMSAIQISHIRDAGRVFFQSANAKRHYHSLEGIFSY